jgi:glycosyltransferase involved in cell wall biosynthesis
VVDDKSTDNTFSILKNYQSKFDFLKVFQNDRNLGFRKNFETALIKCTGEYIALCDQDDVWRLDKIAVQVDLISDNTLVYHDSAFVDENGKTLKKNLSDIVNFYRGNQCHHFLFENCISGHSCFFRKSLLADLLPLPSNMYHDKWLGFVASSKGNISFTNETLVSYRQHSASNTDILKKKEVKKPDSLIKIKAIVDEVKTFRIFLPEDPFINKLHTLLNKRLHQYISLELFLLVYRNKSVLYFFKKKSAWSIFNHCLRYLWGYRFKMLLNFSWFKF